MTDLETLARAASQELLDRTTPDVAARYAELKRVRARRTTAKLAAVAAAVAVAAGGWRLAGGQEERQVEPAPEPGQISNGTLVGRAANGSLGRVAALDGPELAHLPDDAAWSTGLWFSPDGADLLYSNRKAELVAFDVRTGALRTVGACPDKFCSLVQSRDSLMEVSRVQGGLRLEVVAGDHVAPRTLAIPAAPYLGEAAMSPDGTQLAYIAADGLHLFDIDSNQDRVAHRFSGEPDVFLPVSWSPDGSAVAFFDVAGRPRRGYTEMDFTAMTLDVATGATTDLIYAGHCVCLGLAPPSLTWSPDGSVVAIAMSQGGARPGVVLVEPDGDYVETLYLGIGSFTQLAWQPLTG